MAKLVKESLIEEKTTYTQKDYDRMEKISSMERHNDKVTAAEKQAKLIKDPSKAYKRYLAAKDVGLDDRIARIFLNRAEELGHEEAVQQKKQEDNDRFERMVYKAQEKKEKLMPIVNKITKSLDRIGIDYNVSLTSSYPYWNYEGVFIDIKSHMEGAPYQGYTSGGPEYIGNYRPKILGKTLSKIRTIAKRNNADIFKDFNNFFIYLPFKDFK